MKPLLIWLRRGVGWYLAVAVLAFVLTALLAQKGWQVEFDWATRLTASSVLLVCPGVAAAAAFDVANRFRPGLAFLGRGSVRRAPHVLLPALAVALWALVAYAAVWVIAAGVVARRDGAGATDWWVFPEIAAPVLAAGALGALAGTTVRARLASPVAAVATLGGAVVASPWGRGPFEAVTTYGTLTGLQRPTDRAAACVAGAVVVALAASACAVARSRTGGGRRLVYALSTAAMVAASVLPSAWPWKHDVYVPTREAFACVGIAPAVCGPRSRLKLLDPVQSSLAAAYRSLAGTPFTQPTSFRVTRVDHYSDLDGAAPLDFDPAYIRGSHYDSGAVARILLRPHQCRELFDGNGSVRILDAEDRILPWLSTVLAGKAPGRPVPADVASSFQVIATCRVMTGDLH